jgi:hypothetical protein
MSAQYHLFQTDIFPPFFDRADILLGKEIKFAFYYEFFVAIFVKELMFITLTY